MPIGASTKSCHAANIHGTRSPGPHHTYRPEHLNSNEFYCTRYLDNNWHRGEVTVNCNDACVDYWAGQRSVLVAF